MNTLSGESIKSTLENILRGIEKDLLRDSVRILQFETVSGGTPEQEKKYQTEIPACMAWLKSLSETMGFEFRQWDNRSAEIQWRPEGDVPGRPIFGIATHIDVVTPVGQWKHGPFEGVIEDGVLYGRGTQDDKGPLIQALYGLYAVKQSGMTIPCDVRIIIGTCEETGDWSDVRDYLETRGAPDYGFTPDADFPIIIGEKGMINLRFEASWPESAPHEETGVKFLGLKGGQRSNIIPASSEVRLSYPAGAKSAITRELMRETTNFTVDHPKSNITLLPTGDDAGELLVSFLGKAAHSSTPDRGHNAIVDSLRFFADIETIPAPVRAFVQFLALIGSETDGSYIQIDSTHDFVGATTAALTICEIGPTGGFGLLNVRPTMGMASREVLARAEAACEAFGDATGLKVTVAPNGGRFVDAIYLDPNDSKVGPFLSSLKGAFEQATGKPGEFLSIGGTTYAKAFPNFCAFGPVMPGVDEELAHQADERLAVDSIRRNTLVYGLSIALMGINGNSNGTRA